MARSYFHFPTLVRALSAQVLLHLVLTSTSLQADDIDFVAFARTPSRQIVQHDS